MNVFVPEDVLMLPPAETFDRIMALLEEAGLDADNWHARWWAADALTLMGRYQDAIDMHPSPTLERASFQIDRLLSLKVVAGLPYTAADVLALLGPRITTYGREHMDLVRRAAELLVSDEPVEERVQRLISWSRKSPKIPYSVYVGSTVTHRASRGLELLLSRFSIVSEVVDYCRSLSRKAENMVREDAGLPRVGEGWVSETRLFYELRTAFPQQTVEQHASPEWLGRQHLDVYLPDIAVGVEYQGVQHDRPIDFFGGQEAYEAMKKRDARKRRICTRNGIELVYVRPGYEIDAVIAEIRHRAR